MLTELKQGSKVVGVKQTKRAVNDGKAARVFLAEDADPRVTAGSPEGYPLHNPNMVLDESAFALGAAILVNSAVGWLTRHAGQ